LVRSCRRILVVDDDPDTCALIVDALKEEGYTISPYLNGERAREALERERFDLILADIKMPRVTGLDLLHYVRQMGLDTKFILMTAYASLETAIQALRGEAFDYLTKPFPLSELRQRVHEALPDSEQPGQGLVYDDLRIDLNTRRVWHCQDEVELTRQEFDVLACLFQEQGCTVGWRELLQRVWGYTDPSKENIGTLRSCIRRLRLKLGDDGRHPRYIVNKWGEGYRLGQ
jgi:DNA-binding response OmpR family regulator